MLPCPIDVVGKENHGQLVVPSVRRVDANQLLTQTHLHREIMKFAQAIPAFLIVIGLKPRLFPQRSLFLALTVDRVAPISRINL